MFRRLLKWLFRSAVPAMAESVSEPGVVIETIMPAKEGNQKNGGISESFSEEGICFEIAKPLNR